MPLAPLPESRRRHGLALVRLQERRWITFIDLAPLDDTLALYRIFLLSPEALAFLKANAN